MKKLITHSGGCDSMAIMLEYIEKYGAENIISLGFNYGQRHFLKENQAAKAFCDEHKIKRIVLDVPIGQIGGCSLVDHSIPVTENMEQQRSTVVPYRNLIFTSLAGAVAQVQGCDTIVLGVNACDFSAYRDCRQEFYDYLNIVLQAGITYPKKGSEYIKDDLLENGKLSKDKMDIQIDTPLMNETKRETLKRIVDKYGVDIYKYSYTCYNGGAKSCGKCPACIERLDAFEFNGYKDPIEYM